MRTDVLIVGGGLAGLNAAAELRERHPELAVTIADVGGGASSEIMGFCAPVAPGDSPALFRQDILTAGGGLNTQKRAVRLDRPFCLDRGKGISVLPRRSFRRP